MNRLTVGIEQAAEMIRSEVGGTVKVLPNGEAKLWIGKGYLLIGVETEKTAQICWYMKSYDKTPEIKEAVKRFNENYEVVTLNSFEQNQEKVRDGLIARYGLREVLDAENDVAREDWDI